MHFSRYLPFWSERRGDDLAIACGDAHLSWQQWDAQATALAGYWQAQGVKPGDRVGCLLGNGLPWCVAFAASLRMGTIFVPLNPMFGRFELEQIAADADCAVVLSSPQLVSKLGIEDASSPADRARLYRRGAAESVEDYDAAIAGNLPHSAPSSVHDEDVMIICYTSGTTGVPKGVALSHRAVAAAMQGLILNFGLRGGEERLLILAPLAFTGGVISNLTVLLTLGASGFLEATVDPARAYRILVEERITVFGGVPALWERIAMAPGFADADLSQLRGAYTGGAPVPRALADAFISKGVSIRQQYGFTEACGGVSSPDAFNAVRNPGSCGKALPGVDLEIRNPQGQKVSGDEVGEIHARGAQLMTAYWNKADATRDAFDGDWYRTGDLGRYDADGGILVVDRQKNMLISGGVNIYPAEVERGLAQIPGVVESVVFGLPSEQWGQEVAAIVHAPTLTDPAAVLAQARDILGAIKAPKQVRLSARPLPKTASNKIARTGLETLFATLAG